MKKLLCSILALMMVATMLPFSAMADQSYAITCNGCTATLDETYNTLYTPIESAEAGQTVYLVPSIDEGMYVIMYSCTSDDVEIGYNSFVMPEHPVAISVLTGEKADVTFSFENCTAGVDHNLLLFMTDCVGNTVDPSGENEDAEAAFDFDEDDVADVDFSTETDTLYTTQNILANLKKIDKNKVIVPNNDPYNPYGKFTFDFSADLQTVTHTVIWKYDDGTEFARAESVPDGETVHCERTPTKAATTEYEYVFKGWSPEEGPVTADTTYTAVFEQKQRYRTVTWKNWDGKVLQTSTILTTETPVYKGSMPTKKADNKNKYTFSKWSENVNKTTGDTVYTAVFKATSIPIKLTAANKTFKKTQKTKKYTVTLKIDNKAAKKKTIKLKMNNKTYSAKTNNKGQATFKFTKLNKKGTYKATITYKGDPKNVSKKTTIKVK